jgi:hypothetical protein
VTHDAPTGDTQFTVSFSTTAYQHQRNFFTGGVGTQDTPGSIECFFVDPQNFDTYQTGKRFTCYQYLRAGSGTLTISAVRQDWFLIFRNHGRMTNVTVDFSIQVTLPTDTARVQIVTPATSLFSSPISMVGDTVFISGVATGEVTLAVENETHLLTPVNGSWSYLWNTTGATSEQLYHINVTCGDAIDSTAILLQDHLPPSLTVLAPSPGAIVDDGMLLVFGTSGDNVGVNQVAVRVDGAPWEVANGTTTWVTTWDLNGLPLGDHTLTVKAADSTGGASYQMIPFVVNESGHSWGPQIIEVFHLPVNLTNMSNVVVYANVTTTSSFALGHVLLYWQNGTVTTVQEMYRYADHPVQARHEEDPLVNESNAPIYGVELGQFQPGETITYWVVAWDTAQNMKQSDVRSFTIS